MILSRWLRFAGLATAGIALFLLTGCGVARHAGETVRRPGQPDIAYVAEDDAKMTAAMETARSTVDGFIAVLNKPTPAQSEFSIKLPIRDGDVVEHMWVTDVKISGDRFSGQINNEPDQVKTVRLGQNVTAAKSEISDWMYVESGKLRGGYTIRALREPLSEKERREFDRDLPFTIE